MFDFSNKKLDFWTKNNKNVLFIGKHGTGKTSMIIDAFKRNNLKWKVFNAATMDPWTDFVGIPKEKNESKMPEHFETIKYLLEIDLEIAKNWISSNWKLTEKDSEKIINYVSNQKEKQSYLEFIQPKDISDGEIEAFFFDEFNRSPQKVRNAVQELILSKSINGKKFPNLRMIWAAINPEDEEGTYDVEKIDPSQKDRFHIIVNIPYQPNLQWFSEKYGKEIASSAIEWWKGLPNKIKEDVSPRRLEYVIDYYKIGGDLRDVLPNESNISKLIMSLSNGPISEHLTNFLKNNLIKEAEEFISEENNYDASIDIILRSETLINFFVPLMEKEKISLLVSKHEKIMKYVIANTQTVDKFYSVCRDICDANINKALVKKIREAMTVG